MGECAPAWAMKAKTKLEGGKTLNRPKGKNMMMMMMAVLSFYATNVLEVRRDDGV